MKPFAESKLKIDRANKHIADVQAIIRTLPDSYTATEEINPQAGNKVIKHDLSNRQIAVADLALIIGDAVHNLKCALDYAWVGTIERLAPSALGNFAKFPIFATVDKLKIALHGAKIDRSSPALFDFIVGNIKSYEGGNHTLWSIHRLDILDKHRLLIPVLQMAAVDGIEVQNERGKVVKGFTWGSLEQPPYFVPIESGWHIKNKGQISIAIIFDERTPVYSMDVPDMLATFSIGTLNIVQLLEQRFYDPI
jgi:hypothetical protein